MFCAFYCRITSNIPFVIQCDVLVCEQSNDREVSLQTYITAVGRCFLWRIRTLNAFVRRHSGSNATTKRLTLPCSDFTLKCIGDFVVYLNIIERIITMLCLTQSDVVFRFVR